MCVITLAAFVASSVAPAHAQKIVTVLDLPQPGAMVDVSAHFVPPLLKGINVDARQPFKFDFILDTGNSGLNEDTVKDEAQKLIRYFLASLTIPEKDLWVNLSPYEKDRIINDDLSLTEMGRDMLAQDYILKQITSSLIFPENETGKVFWGKVYQRAYELYGTTEVPTDAFHKVWIVPDKAVVYENGTKAFVVEAGMKVMLDTDYLAAQQGAAADDQSVAKDILREVIVPVLEKEVNEGGNFNQLRQIYYSLILAKWYKDTLKDSILNRAYSDQKKVRGVDLEDRDVKQKIYEQYLEAFRKGVFNYVKEERDIHTQELIPRKYFSGGVDYAEKINIKKIFSLPEKGMRGLVGRILRVGGVFDPGKKTEPEKDAKPVDDPQASKPVSPLEKIKAMQRDNFNRRKNSSILYQGRWVEAFPEVETHATSSKRVWKMIFETGGYITPQPTDNLNAPGVPYIFLSTKPQMEYAHRQVGATRGQPVVLEFDFKKLQENGIVVMPGSYSTLSDPDTGEPVRFWSWTGYDETQQKIPLAFLTEKSKTDVILAFAVDAREEVRSISPEEIGTIAMALDKEPDKVKRLIDAAEDFSITEKLNVQSIGLFAKPANRLRVPLEIRKKYPDIQDYYGVKAVLDRRDGRSYFFDIGKPHKEVIAEKFGGIDNDHFGYELQVVELLDGRHVVAGMAMSSQLVFDQQTTLPKIFEADQQLADAIAIENDVKLRDRMYDLELVKRFPGLNPYSPFDDLSLDYYKNEKHQEELVDFVIQLMDVPWLAGRPVNRAFTYDFVWHQFSIFLSNAPEELEKYRAAFEEGRMPEGGFDRVLQARMLDHFGELRQDINVLMSINTRPGRALWQGRALKNGMPITAEQASDLRHYFTGDVMNALESSFALALDMPEEEDAFVSILNHLYTAGRPADEDMAESGAVDVSGLAGKPDDEIIATVGRALYDAGKVLTLRRAEQLLKKAGPEFEIVSQVLFEHMKQDTGVRAELESFGVAFKEALKNAVIWGNRADEKAVVTLKWGMEDREFWIEIMDEGKPFDLEGEEAPPGIDPFFYGGKHGLTALMWRYLSMGSKRLNADGSLGYRVDKGKAIKLETSIDQAEEAVIRPNFVVDPKTGDRMIDLGYYERIMDAANEALQRSMEDQGIRLKVTGPADDVWLNVNVMNGAAVIGQIRAMVLNEVPGLTIQTVNLDPGYQRKKIGTNIYMALNAALGRFDDGVIRTSGVFDVVRSPANPEGVEQGRLLWESLVNQGAARRLDSGKYEMLPSAGSIVQVDATMLRVDVSNLVNLEAEDIVELFRPYLKDKDGAILREGRMEIRGIENFYKPDKDGDAFAVYGRAWQLAEGLLASIHGGPTDRTFWALLDEALRNAFLWGNLGASGETIMLKWRRGELEGRKKFFVEVIDKGRPYYTDQPQLALFQSDVQAGLFGSREGLGKMLDYLSPRSKTTQDGRLRMGYDVNNERGERIGKGIEFAFDMAEDKPVDGGIDFNSDRLDLQRTGEGRAFDWGMGPAALEDVQISGLVPVIMGITPVQDLPALLGSSR